MKALHEFVIPYLGLSEGTHCFSFEIDNSFFLRFEKSKIEKGHIEVDVDFEKQGRIINLKISGEGYFIADCDRCLVEIQVPILFDDKVIIKLSEEKTIQNDEVHYLDIKTSHIDLSPYIYETIHLNLPIKNLKPCESEGFLYCDQEALKRLDNTENNKETPENDNLWIDLKNLDLQ